MKTKIALILILITSMVYEASAYKIIIRGGGRNQKFNKVIVTPEMIKCTGTGNNYCPGSFTKAQGITTGTWYTLDGVINYVTEQVSSGNMSGEFNYKDDLPVSWKMYDEENIEIEVTEKGIELPDDYDTK